MAYRYQSRRAAKKLAQKSKRNFLVSLALITILIYIAFVWVLPTFIGGLGFIKNTINPSKKTSSQSLDDATLAPPVLNIPYEATNSSQIDITGFAASNSKVKLYIDDEEKQITDTSDDGSFTFKDIVLSLGTNNIYGKTLDEKSNESLPSKTIVLTYDNENPPLTISEPEDNKKIQGGNKSVKVSGKTDPKIQIFINNAQIIVNKDGNFSTNLEINEGDNTIAVKAIDQASNTTEIQRRVNYTP